MEMLNIKIGHEGTTASGNASLLNEMFVGDYRKEATRYGDCFLQIEMKI